MIIARRRDTDLGAMSGQPAEAFKLKFHNSDEVRVPRPPCPPLLAQREHAFMGLHYGSIQVVRTRRHSIYNSSIVRSGHPNGSQQHRYIGSSSASGSFGALLPELDF